MANATPQTPPSGSSPEDLPTLDDIIADGKETNALVKYGAKIRFALQKATDQTIKDQLQKMLGYLEKPEEITAAQINELIETTGKLERAGIVPSGLKEEIARQEMLRKIGMDPEEMPGNVLSILQRRKI
jgi:hypothetical protein